jgi:hypothetical protein
MQLGKSSLRMQLANKAKKLGVKFKSKSGFIYWKEI